MPRNPAGFYNIELMLLIIAFSTGLAFAVHQHTFGGALLWFFIGALGGPALVLAAGALAGFVEYLSGSAEKEARRNRKKLIELSLSTLTADEAKGAWLRAFADAERAVAMAAYGVEPETAAAASVAWDRVAPKAYEALVRGEGDKYARIAAAHQLLARFDRLAARAGFSVASKGTVSREFLASLVPPAKDGRAGGGKP